MKKVLITCGIFALMGFINTAVAQTTTGRGGQTQTETQREVKPTQNATQTHSKPVQGRENVKGDKVKGDNGKHLGHERGKGHHKGKGKGHDHHKHDGHNHNHDAHSNHDHNRQGKTPVRGDKYKADNRANSNTVQGRKADK